MNVRRSRCIDNGDIFDDLGAVLLLLLVVPSKSWTIVVAQ